MDFSTLDDLTLFTRVAEGHSEPEIWNEFLNRFSRLCYHAIYRVMARHTWMTNADADELFQKLFEHLLSEDRRVMRRYRGENGCAPGTYLAHLAAFRTLEFVRQHERHSRHEVVGETEDVERSVTDAAETPEHHVGRARAEARIKLALQQMTESDRLLYRLHYQKGLSLTEVSKVMGKAESAVQIQHHRFKDRMRKALTGELEGLAEALE